MMFERVRNQPPPPEPEGGDTVTPGMRGDGHRGAMDAVALALARQEFVAAAHAANPLTRAIALRLASSIAGREPSGIVSGVRHHVTERDRK